MALKVEIRGTLLVRNAEVEKNMIQKIILSPSAFIKKVVLVSIFGFSIITPGFSQCTLTWYRDGDGDGFGRSDISTTTACSDPAPSGFVLNKLDCNDNSSNNQVWTLYGGTLALPSAVIVTKIAVESTGSPITLFTNYTAGATAPLTVKRYNGVGWENLGGDPIPGSDYMDGVDLAIDGNDFPYISYVDRDPLDVTKDKASVMKYNGSAWVQVGAIRFSDLISSGGSVDLFIDNTNTPYVSIVNSASQIVVMKYDDIGAAWVVVGPGAFGSASLPDASIAIDASGVPYVAFAENVDGKISVMKYDGVAWVVVGSSSFSDNDIAFPLVAVDGANNPYVTYFDQAGEVVAQKYNSMTFAWEKLGTTPVFTGNSTSLSFSIDRANDPYVAYRDAVAEKITVKKWNGVSWQVVGTSAFANGLGISMAIGGIDNIPYVSFKDINNGDKGAVTSLSPGPSPPTIPTVTSTQGIICAGSTTTLTINSGNLNDAVQWQWYTASCGGTPLGTGSSISVSPAGTTIYYVRGEGSCVSSPGSCSNISITVNTQPSITASPASPTICSGDNTNFSSSANGTSLSYQWQRNTGSGWNNLSGETTTNLSVNVATPTLTGYQYRFMASNVGCTAAISQPAVLTVNTPPSITASPVSQTACSGGDASFSSSASGTNLSYQWQRNTGGGWNNLPGEITANLLLQSVDASFQGYTYRVEVSNTGCAAVQSQPAEINVNTSPAITNPANVTTCEGSNSSFSVQVNSTGVSYQWQVNAGSNWQNITSGTTTELAVQNITATMDLYKYRVIVSVPQCADVTSNAAVLSVNKIPIITTEPTDIMVCEHEDAFFAVAVPDANPLYQWQVNEGAGWIDIAGEQEATLTISNVTKNASTNKYRVVVSSAFCRPVVSNEAAFSIDLVTCAKELLITEGLSPNGDRNFDYWYIQGIDQYPDNTVKVFNVWGDLIYETKGYNNEIRTWQGQSTNAFAGSSHAPDGTYFYIIDLGNNTSPLRGFVVLKR